MKTLLLLLFLTACFIAAANSQISDWGLPFFGSSGDSTSPTERKNYLISFSNPIHSVLDKIKKMKFTSILSKRNTLVKLEKAFTETAQAAAKAFLKARGLNFESFWINNKIVVQNVSPTLIKLIKKIPGVSKVEEEPIIELEAPVYTGPVEDWNTTRSRRQSSNVEWGIEKIQADKAWQQGFDGEGIVVACIDSGVNYEHESLSSRWRRNYGWFDGYTRTQFPSDNTGHGTHVMGTIAGSHGIGVAPKSTWLACKGCDERCSTSALYRCGQWIQCPTDWEGNNEDCSKAPNVVANSWGRLGSSSWFDDIIESWKTAGIIPVAAIGNSGPECDTRATPGERHDIIGVGSTNIENRISSFSSLGPAGDGRVKPDIVAPGENIRSASHTGIRHYVRKSGTSMACPHVAGVIALLLQRQKNLTYEQVYRHITNWAIQYYGHGAPVTNGTMECGGRRSDWFPNNVYGYGKIDAFYVTFFGIA